MNEIPCTDVVLEGELLSRLLNYPRSLKRVRMSVSDFAFEAHSRIWEAVGRLDADGKRVGPAPVRYELERMGVKNAKGIIERVTAHRPTSSVVEAAERLQELAKFRRIRANAMAVLVACETGDLETITELQNEAQRAVSGDSPVRFETAAESTQAAWDVVANPQQRAKMSVGIPVFDRAIGPLFPGSLTVIGGHQGSGKSSLALTMAIRMAWERKVGFISCEDPRETFGLRIMSALSAPPTDATVAFRSKLDLEQSRSLLAATERSESLGLHMAYAINRPPSDVLYAMRHMVREQECEIVFVDYLQAIRIQLSKGVRIDKAYADVVKRLKSAASELEVPVVLLSQCRRLEAGRGGQGYKEPRPADLKETGDLENEAEVILLCWEPAPGHPARCRLAKLKWGPGGHLWELLRSDAGVIDTIEQPSITRPGKEDFVDDPNDI